MQRFESVDLGRLMWKQTRFGARDFELWSGDDAVGVLYWPKLLSQRAVAECANGKWIIDRVGFLRQRVVVTEANSSAEVASFEPDWLGDGELVLSDGRLFHWYKTKAFRNHWARADEGDNILLEIREWMRWFKHQADVIPHVHPKSLPDFSVLILASWYLGYMRIQDTAAAVAATVAVMG
jgi:hypothetical protein